MPTPVPVSRLSTADQTDVRLVDQCSRLEGLTRLLFGHPRRGQLPQLVVDKRKQFVRGLRIACRGRVEQTSDVGHNAEHTPARTDRRSENGTPSASLPHTTLSTTFVYAPV